MTYSIIRRSQFAYFLLIHKHVSKTCSGHTIQCILKHWFTQGHFLIVREGTQLLWTHLANLKQHENYLAFDFAYSIVNIQWANYFGWFQELLFKVNLVVFTIVSYLGSQNHWWTTSVKESLNYKRVLPLYFPCLATDRIYTQKWYLHLV